MTRPNTRFTGAVTKIGELPWSFITGGRRGPNDRLERPKPEEIAALLPFRVSYPQKLNRLEIIWLANDTEGAWLANLNDERAIYFEFENDAILFRLTAPIARNDHE